MRPNRVARRRVSYECCLAPLKLGLFGPLALYVCAWLFGPKLQPSDSHLAILSLFASSFCHHIQHSVLSCSFRRNPSVELKSSVTKYSSAIRGQWPLILANNIKQSSPNNLRTKAIELSPQRILGIGRKPPKQQSGHGTSSANLPLLEIVFVTLSAQRFCLAGVEHLSSPVLLITWCLRILLQKDFSQKLAEKNQQFFCALSQKFGQEDFTHFHSVTTRFPWAGHVGSAQRDGRPGSPAFLPGVHHDGLTTQTLTVQSRDGLESLPHPKEKPQNWITGWLNHVESC